MASPGASTSLVLLLGSLVGMTALGMDLLLPPLARAAREPAHG